MDEVDDFDDESEQLLEPGVWVNTEAVLSGEEDFDEGAALSGTELSRRSDVDNRLRDISLYSTTPETSNQEAQPSSRMQSKLVALNKRIWNAVMGEAPVAEEAQEPGRNKPITLSREKRLHLAHLHELHTLSLLERARIRSKWCDDPGLQQMVLERLPPPLRHGHPSRDGVVSLLSWLHTHISLDPSMGLFVSCSSQPRQIDRCGISQLQSSLARQLAGMDHFTLLYIALARTLGYRCRLVSSLEPMPFNKAGIHVRESDPKRGMGKERVVERGY